jgi:crotonobetainyl-CoA:carnitine CoA-transferase CaiB-like acyl-CoA transferase
MNEPAPVGPLADLRVLDLADEKGAYCTKLLADLGADVIKIEPPGGDPTRRFAPFLAGAAPPGPESSLFFWYFNTGKRSLLLDLERADARGRLLDLVAGADCLVESFPTGYLAARGLAYATLRARNPRLIQTSITPFGQTGPHAGWAGNDLTAWAMSGIMLLCGDVERPPLRGAGGQANLLASLYAAVATLAALAHRRRTGEGQAIDVSMQEAGLLHAEAVYLVYQHWNAFVERLGQGQHPLAVPAIAARARDGYCQAVTYSRAQWQSLVEWMAAEGMAGDLADPRWLDPALRLQYRERIHDLIEEFCARSSRQDLLAEAQRRNLAFGSVRTPAEVAEDPALAAREYFVTLEPPRAGRAVRFPGAPYRLSETPWAIQSPPPALPQPGAEVAWRARAEMGASPAPKTGGAPSPRPASGYPAPRGSGDAPDPDAGPLAGQRVLDFTWIVAGPFASMLLADLGADVIKVEAPGVGDPVRGMAPLDARGAPPNNGAGWNVLNRGKRSITLNLSAPETPALAARLAGAADVVIENFSPGTFERLIGDPEEWRRANPRLIVARLSGFGRTGERRSFLGYAPTLHALSGLTYLTAYDSLEPDGLGTSYSDYIGGLSAALAILAALDHRDRIGRGQSIDVAQLEAVAATLGPAILEAIANGRVAHPAGNRLAERPDAPQGVYHCRVPEPPAGAPAEDEAWLAIAVTSDAEWEGLRRALGNPEWMRDPAYATAAGRVAGTARIDSELNAWTRDREPQAAMAHLQAQGVPAGVAQNGRDLLERDSHLAARDAFVTVDHAELGPVRLPGPGFRLERTPAAVRRPPPLLGQHTEEVLRDVLGLGEAEINQLILKDVL